MKKKQMWFLLIFLVFLLRKDQVYAAEAVAEYGSQEYEWDTQEVSPIGVYLKSESAIGTYEICVEYDPLFLKYLNGADESVDNRLYIRGEGDGNEIKRMLHFEPLIEGNTKITIVSATASTKVDEANGIGAEQMTVTALDEAPVIIGSIIDNTLVQLTVTPVEIEQFQPHITEYHLKVNQEIESININYATKDERAQITISDTSLLPGENIITVTVHGTEEKVYTLYVTREEQNTVMDPEQQLNQELEQEMQKETEKEEENKEQSNKENSGNGNIDKEDILAEDTESETKSTFKEKIETLFLTIATATLIVLLVLKQLQFHKKKHDISTNSEDEDWEDDDLEIINLEQTIIEAKHLSMEFKLSTDEASSLKEFFIRTLKRENTYRLFAALKDVSFEIKQGDVVGIIGSNGSGKSTLLKIISGALIPSKGTIRVDKSKVQILTLGTGFDMELTGKENVYLNGAIIGYTKEYLDEKYQDIVRFAELEGFMEERMKNYSSGMVSRLGFAIATMRDAPEILILDEVLSVGDMFFRKKSEKRIKELIHSGSTVIMVSHSMDTILKNCNKVIWIEKGKLMEMGNPKKICANYQEQRIQYETAVNHLQLSGQ